ncbi:MFS transporter [Deinococcus maricopensis]|uniref:Major facilitator superfamily MFS_1 n=1 Tax=Deinococcus maricopensis (strain DSM 21211 / LMG 22137 / NRRL B-23946 / LB-34) TaxID=709986 RepID=E8UAQ9_DEIML|nr:MFS transporter [Deinococcus maricopensis]ADV68148.1 major facilitator superfamily MFS_1 [Deinococcus maricopensis DSM 21211]
MTPSPSTALQRLLGAYPTSFWVMWGGTLINRAGDFVIPFLGLYLTTVRGFSVEQASVVLSALGVGGFFAQSLGGTLTDRIGRKPVMVFALLGGAATLAALAFARPYAAILALVTLYALISNTYRPASGAAVADLLSGDARARAYGLLYWAINVGAAIAPVLGGLLAGLAYGWLFALNAAAMTAYALLLIRHFREPARDPQPPGARLTLIPKDALLWAYAAATFLFALVWLQGYTTLALALARQGFNAGDYGRIIAVNGILIVVLGLPINRLIATGASSRLLALSSVLLGGGFALHALQGSVALHALAVGVWTLGELINFTIMKNVIADLAPPHLRGTYQGVSGSMWGLASFAAPLAGGFLLTHRGAPTLWFSALGMALLVAALHLLLGPHLRARHAAHTDARA